MDRPNSGGRPRRFDEAEEQKRFLAVCKATPRLSGEKFTDYINRLVAIVEEQERGK